MSKISENERETIFKNLIEDQLKDNAMFEFDGFTCNDDLDEEAEPCSGWDGKSSRCECGNRRVSWALSEDLSYVYPESY